MQIETLTVGALSTNCYLVADAHGEAVAIDPGDEAARLLQAAAAHEWHIRAVLLTHLHIDHFLAAPELCAQTAAPLILPRAEQAGLQDEARSLMTWLPTADRFTLSPDQLVEDGDTVQVGALTLTFWHTPGHTAGSGCWLCEDALFCGDTLFAGSVGRTDLPSGDRAVQRETLRRLAARPEDWRLFPGHGAPSTLATERRSNPYLK